MVGGVEPCPSPFVGNSMLRIAFVISAMFHCCSCLSCVSIFISLHAYWNFIISSYKCNKMLIYMYNVHVGVGVHVCVCEYLCVLNKSQKFAHALPIDAHPSRLLVDDHIKPEETARQTQQAEQPNEKAMCVPSHSPLPFCPSFWTSQPFNSSATGLVLMNLHSAASVKVRATLRYSRSRWDRNCIWPGTDWRKR